MKKQKKFRKARIRKGLIAQVDRPIQKKFSKRDINVSCPYGLCRFMIPSIPVTGKRGYPVKILTGNLFRSLGMSSK